MYAKRFLGAGLALVMGFSMYLGQTGEAKALATNELESLVYAGPEGDFHLLFTFDFCADATCSGDALSSDLDYDAGDFIRIKIANDSTSSAPRLFQVAFESGWAALINGVLSVTDTGLDSGSFNFASDGASIPAANTMPDVPFTTFQRFRADPNNSAANTLDQFEMLTIVGLIDLAAGAALTTMELLVNMIEDENGFLRIGGQAGGCDGGESCHFYANPLPAAAWLFISAILGLIGFGARRRGNAVT